MTAPVALVRERLERLGRRTRGRHHSFMAQCPTPDHGEGRGDRHPSLHVSEGEDGRALVYCFAGCDLSDVLAPLRLEARDLFPNRASFRPARRRTRHTHEIVIAGNCGDQVVMPPTSVDGTPEPPRMRPIDRAVLGEIKAHAFFYPRSCPSQALIARLTGYTREEVNRSCDRLRDYGLISWTKDRRPGSRWLHNVYRIHTFWSRPYRAVAIARLARVRASLRCLPHSKRTAKDVKGHNQGLNTAKAAPLRRSEGRERPPPAELWDREGERQEVG
jgi:hypothetical protein